MTIKEIVNVEKGLTADEAIVKRIKADYQNETEKSDPNELLITLLSISHSLDTALLTPVINNAIDEAGLSCHAKKWYQNGKVISINDFYNVLDNVIKAIQQKLSNCEDVIKEIAE